MWEEERRGGGGHFSVSQKKRRGKRETLSHVALFSPFLELAIWPFLRECERRKKKFFFSKRRRGNNQKRFFSPCSFFFFQVMVALPSLIVMRSCALGKKVGKTRKGKQLVCRNSLEKALRFRKKKVVPSDCFVFTRKKEGVCTHEIFYGVAV